MRQPMPFRAGMSMQRLERLSSCGTGSCSRDDGHQGAQSGSCNSHEWWRNCIALTL